MTFDLVVQNILQAKRIIIQGSSGAGKSTLAQELALLLQLPIVHMDKEFWQPGWKRPNSDEWHQRQLEFIKRDKWIIEGGAYQRALPLRTQASDFVIYLDFNRFFCLYRCLKRYLTYRGKSRPDMAEGCFEQMDYAFVKWIIYEQPQITGPIALKTIKENIRHQNLIIFKNPSQIKKFLHELHKSKNILHTDLERRINE